MSKLPNWIYWFVFYGALAGIFAMAQAGDPYARAAFPTLVTLRGLSIIILAWNLTSAWIQPRGITVNVLHFAIEVVIALALILTGHYLVAMLSILTLALYEFARARVAYPT